MYPFSLFLTPLSIFLSLTTATGVVVHDTRIDRATMTALSVPSAVASAQGNSKLVNYATDSHTHVERHTLSSSELKSDSPRINPRSNADRKHVLQKRMGLGPDPLDSYLLPLS
jgi:hypothetical protein